MNKVSNIVAEYPSGVVYDASQKLIETKNAGVRCASLLRKGHASLTEALIKGKTGPRENSFADSKEAFRSRVGESLNLLIQHVKGTPNFAALYAGQRLSELYRADRSREENLRLSRASVAEDGEILREYLAPLVSAEELGAFERAYQTATAGLVNEASRRVRTLFIGDCLQFEIISFLMGMLLADGLSVDPYPVNARGPSQLRDILDALPEQQFDMIIFSPFSHARLPELDAILYPTRHFMSRAERNETMSSILTQTQSLLDYLSKRFECPIFVHNAALVQRFRNPLVAAIYSVLTRPLVTRARERINQWLSDYVALHNSSTFRHLFVLDEDAVARRFGRIAMARHLYTSDFQHATVFSQKLSSEYHLRISVVGKLLGKKLVICDLDNTLWDGIIGEGSVRHFEDRQRTLKKLKDHGGIVLSIASKNDPANVKFEGGTLSDRDFVAPQISWGQKAEAVARIKKTLNLQTKHMVFIDDRADERALVQEAFPDILTLDACDPSTWRGIELWADLAYGSSDVDRTKLYQDQAKRDASADLQTDSDQPNLESLKKLGLVISIRAAEKGDLKRVAELINRTNQWNLCGSRTTFEQVREWHNSQNALVLLASAADRFGDMGTVCVSVVTMDAEKAEIPIFVLSCRVFGYGVETAMLNEIIARCRIGEQRTALVGSYRANNQNHPCRNMYNDHGFVATGNSFVWDGSRPQPLVAWAEISVK